MSEEAAVNIELLVHLPCSLPQVNAEMIKKQVEVVGAESLFHRLDKSLKDLRTEPLFIREQWNLYSWRHSSLRNISLTVCWESTL